MIAYLKGNYKYTLALHRLPVSKRRVVEYDGAQYYEHRLGFKAPRTVNSYYVKILAGEDGDSLLIRNGYAWDGASGPTIDTKDTMRASLIHDALWQLVSEGNLSEKYRARADAEFLRVLLEDGVPAWRAKTWKWAVSNLGKRWVKHFGTRRRLHTAPRSS